MERRNEDLHGEKYKPNEQLFCLPEGARIFNEIYGIIICNRDYSKWRESAFATKKNEYQDIKVAFEKGRKFEHFLKQEVGLPKKNILKIHDATNQDLGRIKYWIANIENKVKKHHKVVRNLNLKSLIV